MIQVVYVCFPLCKCRLPSFNFEVDLDKLLSLQKDIHGYHLAYLMLLFKAFWAFLYRFELDFRARLMSVLVVFLSVWTNWSIWSFLSRTKMGSSFRKLLLCYLRQFLVSYWPQFRCFAFSASPLKINGPIGLPAERLCCLFCPLRNRCACGLKEWYM